MVVASAGRGSCSGLLVRLPVTQLLCTAIRFPATTGGAAANSAAVGPSLAAAAALANAVAGRPTFIAASLATIRETPEGKTVAVRRTVVASEEFLQGIGICRRGTFVQCMDPLARECRETWLRASFPHLTCGSMRKQHTTPTSALVGWLTTLPVRSLAQKTARCCSVAAPQIRCYNANSTLAAGSSGCRRVLLFTTTSKLKGVKVENWDVLAKRSTRLPFLLFGLGVTPNTIGGSAETSKYNTRGIISLSRTLSPLAAAGERTTGSRGDVGFAFLQYILQRKVDRCLLEDDTSRGRTLVQGMGFTPSGSSGNLFGCTSERFLRRTSQQNVNPPFPVHDTALWMPSTCRSETLSNSSVAAPHTQHCSSTASYISSLLLPHVLLARSCLDAGECGFSVARLLHLYRLTQKALIVCYASTAMPLGFFSLEEGCAAAKTGALCAAETNATVARVSVNRYRRQASPCSVAVHSVERALNAPDFLRLRFGIRSEKGSVHNWERRGVEQLLYGQPSKKEMSFLYQDVFPYALELLEKLLLGDSAVSTDALRLRPQYPLQEGSRKKPLDRKKSERNYLNKIYRRMDRK